MEKGINSFPSLGGSYAEIKKHMHSQALGVSNTVIKKVVSRLITLQLISVNVSITLAPTTTLN